MLTAYQRGSLFGAVLMGASFVFALATTPNPERSERPNEANSIGSNHQQKESFWQAAAADPIAVFTLGLVLIAASQAALFVWQLGLMKDGVDDARIAAIAARDGALASRDSADTAKLALVASERAYVHYSGMKWISHTNGATGEVFWRIRPMWTNAGNTPTRRLIVNVSYVFRDERLPATHEFTVALDPAPAPATIYPKGLIESQFNDVDGAVLQTIKDGAVHLYVVGVATYRDVFDGTPQRVTKFCVYATNITGDPTREWHDENNPVHIMFGHFGAHNCSDEDCEIQA
jgi:hypothetical protein